MRPLPEACRNREGIDPLVLPPGALISTPVEAAGVEFIDENGGGPGVRLRKSGKEKPRK